MPDQLTETLDFLSVRVDAARTTPEAFDLDELLGEAGRALAALGVVLKLAAEWDQSATDLDEMAVRAAERGAADFRVEEMVTRVQAHRDCAQKLRSAISGELLGTKDSDDGNPRCKNCHVPVRRCGCTWPHPGCDRTGGWVHVDTGHGCAGARGTCAEPESTKGGGCWWLTT